MAVRALFLGLGLLGHRVSALPQGFALPQQNALNIGQIPATTASFSDPSNTASSIVLPTIMQDLKARKLDQPETVHTESTETQLLVPTLTGTPTTTTPTSISTTTSTTTPAADSATTSSGRAFQQPQTVHDESSAITLILPTAQTTQNQPTPQTTQEQPTPQTTSIYQLTVPATTPQADTQPTSSEEPLTIFIEPTQSGPAVEPAPTSSSSAVEQGTALPTVHIESTMSALLVSVSVAAIGQALPTNTIPTTLPAITTALYTSQGVLDPTTIIPTPSGAAQVSSPAVLRSSQSGAIGIAAGSAVTIGGTTYSVASGGSAIYINGFSSSLPAYVHHSVTLSTSQGVVHSNGAAVQPTGTVSMSKPPISSSSSSASRTATTLSSSTTSSAPTSSASLPNAGVAQLPQLTGFSIAAMIAWLVIM